MTGNCVDMIVMLAAVIKAEIGIYGMTSTIHPSRKRPIASRIAPAMKDSVFAISTRV